MVSELVNSTTASEIKDAVNTLASTSQKRIEGEQWKAYCVGDNVVRVDVKIPNKEN